MSKRITTRWYIGAWLVTVLAGIAHRSVSRPAPPRVRPGPVSAFVKSSDPLDSLGSGHSSTLGPGPLAQLAERRADNAEVGGSSPPRPTKLAGISHSGTVGRIPHDGFSQLGSDRRD